VYREVKSVLLTELSHLKNRIPVYSNINKRIIENEVIILKIPHSQVFLVIPDINSRKNWKTFRITKASL